MYWIISLSNFALCRNEKGKKKRLVLVSGLILVKAALFWISAFCLFPFPVTRSEVVVHVHRFPSLLAHFFGDRRWRCFLVSGSGWGIVHLWCCWRVRERNRINWVWCSLFIRRLHGGLCGWLVWKQNENKYKAGIKWFSWISKSGNAFVVWWVAVLYSPNGQIRQTRKNKHVFKRRKSS